MWEIDPFPPKCFDIAGFGLCVGGKGLSCVQRAYWQWHVFLLPLFRLWQRHIQIFKITLTTLYPHHGFASSCWSFYSSILHLVRICVCCTQCRMLGIYGALDTCCREGVACYRGGVVCYREGVACYREGVACYREGVVCYKESVACYTL